MTISKSEDLSQKIETSGAPVSNGGRIASVALVALSVAYPFLVLFLMRHVGAWPLIGLVALLACARAFLRPASGRALPLNLAAATLAAVTLLVLVSLKDPELGVRVYPVLMNLSMLAAFLNTLFRPPSMIERFARLMEPNLPQEGVIYTRRVTWVWCGFFICNALISLWTAYAQDLHVWALYNGVISYALIGTLIAGEWMLRGFLRKPKGS